MKRIFIANPKGGSGKTTIAINLAGYYATHKFRTAIIETDSQRSSFSWLEQRPKSLPVIKGAFIEDFQGEIPFDVEVVIIDTPAASNPEQFAKILNKNDTLIMPVLPSPIDTQAAGQFIFQLISKNKLSTTDIKFGFVANRTRTYSKSYQALCKFVNNTKIPLVASLRDSVNYVHTYNGGRSIFDSSLKSYEKDFETWKSLIDWLET